MQKLELPSNALRGIGGFGAKIFVFRPEGVHRYVERAKTEIENDINIMEKFVEFQPYTVKYSKS